MTITSSMIGPIEAHTSTLPARRSKNSSSDGTPVPVVASYGMTSGFTSPEGITAPMLIYDPAHPPSAAELAGKILVFQTAPYPSPPYSESFLDNFTPTDYEWRSPGKWPPLFVPPSASVTSSYHSRWVWSQLNGFAADRDQGTRSGHRRRVRSVAGCRVRARATQRLHTGRQGGSRREVCQLPDAHARSCERGKGAGRREGREDRHLDPHRSLPARHRQSRHRVSAGQELRYAAGRTGPARHAHRRHVADRGERRPGHARDHVLLQSSAAVGAAAHPGVLLRLPALHAGRRGQLAAIRLLQDTSRAPETDRGYARHGAHGWPADDRSRARRQ